MNYMKYGVKPKRKNVLMILVNVAMRLKKPVTVIFVLMPEKSIQLLLLNVGE